MIHRLFSVTLIVWFLGFVLFAVSLPQPVGNAGTDGVVVLTGGKGRIDRGFEVLRQGWARRLLISGVDHNVKPREFAARYKANAALMACCVTLGYRATDTVTNGTETADWVKATQIGSLRLVTSDWHMRRASLELRRALPPGFTIVEDAVPTQPSLYVLFLEYHKLMARYISGLWKH
ncbi:MAG: YdcF family protein [Sphingomonadales bacterium]|nr:YdcF family protein [Sphingomonadales bacterium]